MTKQHIRELSKYIKAKTLVETLEKEREYDRSSESYAKLRRAKKEKLFWNDTLKQHGLI